MAVSKTDIANQALNHIGEPTIMDITDKDNATARIINSVYDVTFREIARDHDNKPWISNKVMFSVLMGAIKELNQKIENLK